VLLLSAARYAHVSTKLNLTSRAVNAPVTSESLRLGECREAIKSEWLAEKRGALLQSCATAGITYRIRKETTSTFQSNRKNSFSQTLRWMKLRSISLNSAGCSLYEKWPARLKIYIRESCVFREMRSNRA